MYMFEYYEWISHKDRIIEGRKLNLVLAEQQVNESTWKYELSATTV